MHRPHLEVGDEGVGEVAESARLAVGLDPRQVGELGVHRHAEHLAVERGELLVAVREGGDFWG